MYHLSAHPSAVILTDSRAYWIVIGAFTVLGDFILLVIPIRPIMQLPLTLIKRLGLILVFLAGVVATATSAATIVMTYDFRYRTNADRDWERGALSVLR